MTHLKNLLYNSRLQKVKANYLAFIVIFLIAFIYLFPGFLGKVDTPIDIRDTRMYPWRYHSIDKKIKKIVLWEVKNKENAFTFYPTYNEKLLSKLNKLKEKQYYLTLEFKSDKCKEAEENVSQDKGFVRFTRQNRSGGKELYKEASACLKHKKGTDFGFSIQFVSKFSNYYLEPKLAIYPSLSNKETQDNTWYTAYVPLTNTLQLGDLKYYNIQLVQGGLASLLVKNLKIVFEDISGITRVHSFLTDDLILSFTPGRELFSNSLKQGKLPFWTNDILCGIPFLAEPQVGFFHPLYFLSYLIFDHFTAHFVVIFISFILCGIGAFFLSSLWGLGFAPSLLTAIVYMFHPFNTVWFSYEHVLMCSAVLPFVMITYEKSLNRPEFFNKYLLISAALLGLIFITGHLQHVYYTVIFFFLYTLFRFLKDLLEKDEGLQKHFFSIVFVFTFGIMVGAIVLVPFFPLLKDSYRVSWSDDYIRAYSIPLNAFIGLIFPYYKGYPKWSFYNESDMDWEFMKNYVYFGLLPFVFLLFSFRHLFKNKLVIFFLVTVIFSILISTGSPLFFLVRDFLPGFRQLQHYRFLQVYSFCVPFLAGIGFQVFLSYFSFLKEKTKIVLLLVVFLITTFDLMYYASFFVTWSNRREYKPVHKGGSLEYLLKIKKEAKKNVSQDIGFVRFTRQNRSGGKELHKEASACLKHKKESKEPFRVLPFTIKNIEGLNLKGDVAVPNTLRPYGLEEPSGYSSFVLKDLYYLFVYSVTRDPSNLYKDEIIKLFFNPSIPYPIYNFKSKVLDLLNVRYFLVPPVLTLAGENIEKVFSGDCAIYENKDYLPRAFFVENYKVIESPKETIIALDSDKFNPRKEVILMTHIEEVQASLKHKKGDTEAKNVPSRNILSAGKEGKRLSLNVCQIKYEQNKITLKAKVDNPGFLVLGHNLDKNWKVKINKKEGSHYQANLVQRAVYLPKSGKYLIEFYYFPKLFIIGGSISCFAIFILILLGLLLKFRKAGEGEKPLYQKTKKIKIGV